MKEVVIAGYLRTAISRSRPMDPGRDWFHQLRGDELLGQLLPELIKRTGVEPEEIEDFLVGSANGVGEQWAYGGRTPIFQANLPATIAAKFVDQQCGSTLAGAQIAYMEIAQGFADVVMVGGMENMTRVPMGIVNERGLVSLNLQLFMNPEYAHWDMMTSVNMGLTAEKLFAQTDLTKEDMEAWAVRSHQRAAQAQKDGFFDGEIMPIEAPQADGSMMTVTKDQAVRGDTTLEGLASLKPAFKKGGAITAGVSSPLNTAATGLILMSKEKAEEKGIKPLAYVRSMGFAGVDPSIMGVGPVPASQKALAHIGLDAAEVDFWEINEAFAIVALNCIKELGLDEDKVNVMGGGVAIGHPLGATGCRLIGTLARILQAKGGRWGVANACVGGGQGVAVVLENV